MALGVFLTGCGFQISNNSWSGDLTAATNVTRQAEIPATLKALTVKNRFGTVHVRGAEGASNEWTWTLAVRARTDEAAQRLALAATCKAELVEGHLQLIVSLPETSEPHSIQSDIEITVPKAASVRADNHFGRTEIAGLTGTADATDENGSMEISDVHGTVRAETSFSRLAVRNTGAAVLHNQNGEIEATGIAGTLEAETSFATMTARDIHGKATLANENGKIEAVNIGGPLTARTSFAPLEARDIDGAVHLRDQNGRIELNRAAGAADVETSFSSLSVDGVEGDALLVNQNGGVDARGVTGKVDATTSFASMEIRGGGPEFVCHNQNGSIQLRATSTALKRIEAETSFAALELHLPAGVKPTIQAHTTFAEVESDFPVLMKPHGENAFADAEPGVLQVSLRNQNGKIGVVRD